MRTLRTDIPGLDLVLGGGIPTVVRGEGLREAATILIRGPAGSGKSVFGTQLAGALARKLGCDVAYGCVELLPHELREQHASFGRAGERVVVPPFSKQEPRQKDECRVFAAVLALGDTGSERAAFGAAVLELLDVVTESGGDPRVLVVDSLSDGYGLGASAPRRLADELCKVAAERGMILIMLEETTDERPSPWGFASDVVFTLEVEVGGSALSTRRITLPKNRFAPSDPGPHQFTIHPSRGIVSYPRPAAYLTPWARELVLPAESPDRSFPAQDWSVLLDGRSGWPAFRNCVTAVFGANGASVRELAGRLGTTLAGGQPCPGSDVVIDFGGSYRDPFERQENAQPVVVDDPFVSGNHFLAGALRRIEARARSKNGVRRVILGDFRHLRSFQDAEGILRAVAVLAKVLRRAGIPMVLFETMPGRTMEANRMALASEIEPAAPNVPVPPIADLADVLIEVVETMSVPVKRFASVTDVRRGLFLREPGRDARDAPSQ